MRKDMRPRNIMDLPSGGQIEWSPSGATINRYINPAEALMQKSCDYRPAPVRPLYDPDQNPIAPLGPNPVGPLYGPDQNPIAPLGPNPV
ncbi:MAG: hypothetical protein JXA57_11005, partial [Armatimonadetes bacterium]|nr:hypothetical protein [Armatimonadota bacterium]